MTQTTRLLGFRNLLQRENTAWWRGKRWLFWSGISCVGMGGFLALVLFVLPEIALTRGEVVNPLELGQQTFFGLSFMAVAVATIILTQDIVIGEKESGTAAWVLSKPISRSSYILAKAAAYGLGILVTLIALPGLVAYILFSLSEGSLYPAGPFALGLFLLVLHTLFYLVLSVLMGIVTNNRMVLLGVALGSILGGMLLVQVAGPIMLVTPWPLSGIALGLVSGTSLPLVMLVPVLLTVLFTLVMFTGALKLFSQIDL
nr:ABC transporter permease subunit [Anaerolineae bacterium]